MDLRKIKKLIELLDESGIAELEVTEGEESVRISRYGSAPPLFRPPDRSPPRTRSASRPGRTALRPPRRRRRRRRR